MLACSQNKNPEEQTITVFSLDKKTRAGKFSEGSQLHKCYGGKEGKGGRAFHSDLLARSPSSGGLLQARLDSFVLIYMQIYLERFPQSNATTATFLPRTHCVPNAPRQQSVKNTVA